MYVLITLGVLIALFPVGVYLFMKTAPFGGKPQGERLERIRRSPNFRDGEFQNQSVTPQLTEGATYLSVMRQFFFEGGKKRKPLGMLPSQKVDLHKLDPARNVLVWFGHSSYFLQVDGKRFLVDPVFSGHASPVRGSTRSFMGSDLYTADDMPEIDYLLITHDHWDHLDHKTVVKLEPRVKRVVTALGVGAHLEKWGFAPGKIAEGDWGDEIDMEGAFRLAVTPARHFSGRGFKRNGTLWVSFVLTTPGKKIYIGGDSGYDAHFAFIGSEHGPFDIAILENGQYNKSWKHIHMLPAEVVQAAADLRARWLLPVHWGKFTLSPHDWDEPIKTTIREAERNNTPVLHPQIGEPMDLDHPGQFGRWWEGR